MISQKYMSTPLYIILIAVPLIITPFSMDSFYYPKIIAVYLILCVITAFHFVSRSKSRISVGIEVKVLFLYWLTLIISTCFATNIPRAIYGSFLREEGLIAILAYGLLFIFAKTYFRRIEKYFNLIIASAVLVALYGIFQYFGIDPIPRDPIRLNWSGRAFSTMGNPNFLGSYLVLMIPLSVFSYLRKGKIHNLLATSILYLCLLLTFTRSAFLGFGVILISAIAYAFKNKSVRKKMLIILLIFILITAFVNTQSNGKLSARFLSIGKEAHVMIEKDDGYEKGGAGRVYLWSRTLRLVKEKPLVGFGLENLETAFVERYHDEMMDLYGKSYNYDKAHNEYLHIAVSTGIPSLIIYLLFIALCLLKGIRSAKSNYTYVPYLVGVLAYLVQAFFNISVVSVAYVFWIFLGVITNNNICHESHCQNL